MNIRKKTKNEKNHRKEATKRGEIETQYEPAIPKQKIGKLKRKRKTNH